MVGNRNFWLVAGFICFLSGMTALAMQLVGVYWWFLKWLELGGGLFAFLAKITLIIGGILMIVFARTDWEKEKHESS